MNDGDVTTEALDNFKNMRSEEDRHAALGHAGKERLERAGSESVNTFERFIEEENSRPMNYRGGKS